MLAHLTDPRLIGSVYVLSEIFLAITKRSRLRDTSRDRQSLIVLWVTITLAVFMAQFPLTNRATASLPHPNYCAIAGLIIFLFGITLRWWAIFHLGRFFTVDVSIAAEHELIDNGPYRWIRHPSYTGALLAFVGFGLAMGNWLSIICLLLPITAAFLWRIHVEERALIDALGDPYRQYMSRTWRLIPFLY